MLDHGAPVRVGIPVTKMTILFVRCNHGTQVTSFRGKSGSRGWSQPCRILEPAGALQSTRSSARIADMNSGRPTFALLLVCSVSVSAEGGTYVRISQPA